MFDEEGSGVIESLPGAVLAFDDDGYLVTGNESAAVVMGKPVQELTGLHLTELEERGLFVEGTHATYREAVTPIADASDTTEEASFEVAIRLGGTSPPRRFSVEMAAHRDGETFRGTLWSMIDVGTGDRYGETIEALHDATRELMAAADQREAQQIAARAANEVLGFAGVGVRRYDPDRDVLAHVSFGGTVDNIDARPDFSIEESPHGEAFRTGETVIERVPNEDDPYDREVFSHAMYVPLGEYGVLSLGTVSGPFDDVDRRFAEILAENTVAALNQIAQREQLREQQRELQRQNERLEEFASIVSHDLKSPMGTARSAFELYRESDSADHERVLDRTLDRMDRIVEDVLQLAQQGGSVEEVEPVNLREAATVAWSIVDGEATLNIESNDTVLADRDRLVRVFENLFTNAVEHGQETVEEGDDGTATRQKSDPLTVTVESLTAGFAVADNGIGIPAERREEIFEHGFTTHDEGTGYGLAIVDGIVAAHDWSINVTESASGGTRFEITGVDFTA